MKYPGLFIALLVVGYGCMAFMYMQNHKLRTCVLATLAVWCFLGIAWKVH